MESEGHLYAAAAPSLTTAISVAVAAGESLLHAAIQGTHNATYLEQPQALDEELDTC